ncbi:phage protein NinX family protein [Massilia timonae]|uniref:phage protein NinX family protein n=1 Tax=Massilia timonae TaxID=47229 RepID=UPI0028D908F5|nr:phage protein NinX family protein [Massilia timonae]
MRTAELTGELLDYWVARANGWTFGPQHKALECDVWRDADGQIVGTIPASAYRPSTDWALGGPIIERERLIIAAGNNYWAAIDTNPANGLIYEICEVGRHGCTGPTPLVAAMRVYVASKFGDVVEDVERAAQLDGGQGEGK